MQTSLTSKPKAVVGIDPGWSGGIGIYSEAGAEVIKMPDTERDILIAFSEIAENYVVSRCYIERVHSMPKQGVRSSFKFGYNFGLLVGLVNCQEWSHVFVPPQKWQRTLGCLSGGDKNVTKRRAQELYPSLKITHATADAMLIAHYGFTVEMGSSFVDRSTLHLVPNNQP